MKKLSLLTVAISLTLIAQAYATDQQVVVTASKQSQYAASSQNVAQYSVNTNQLEDANIVNSQQLYKVLPGVNIGTADGFMTPQTSIRGVSSMDFFNSALTLYIDGVPQPSVAFIQPLGDVKKVEMLKGPQSTLYGKAAQGGIVDIITEQPGADYQGYLSGGYASRDGYRSKVYLNGPLVDSLLYGSISGLHQVANGRLINPNTGNDHLTDQRDSLGSAELRLAPDSQPWEISVNYTAQCNNGAQGIYIPFDQINSITGAVGKGAPDSDFHRCIQNQSLRGQYDGSSWLLSAVSAWQQLSYHYTFPFPGTMSGSGVAGANNKWLSDIQEIRLASQGADNLIDGVVGLYRENIRHFGYDQSGNNTLYSIKSQSLAVYGDITWHIISDFDLGAGLRFAHDTANMTINSNYADSTKNHVSGQLSAGYQLTKTNRIYARIAQGYQAGGFDHGGIGNIKPYLPEKTITYELGNKYHSDNLNLQGAVFYSVRNDVQMYRGVISHQTLQNAGDANALGLELAADYIFTPGWKVGANINLINSTFTNNSNNESYAGKRVPFVPNYSGAVYLSGNITTSAGTLSPYIGINMSGSYTFKDSSSAIQKSYTTADIRLAWQATSRIIVSAYLDNIFDKRYAAYAFDFPGTSGPLASVNHGRTVGVDVKIDIF